MGSEKSLYLIIPKAGEVGGVENTSVASIYIRLRSAERACEIYHSYLLLKGYCCHISTSVYALCGF